MCQCVIICVNFLCTLSFVYILSLHLVWCKFSKFQLVEVTKSSCSGVTQFYNGICLFFSDSDSFKKILLCLSGVAIKLQEGEYDAEPPSKTVGLFFSKY